MSVQPGIARDEIIKTYCPETLAVGAAAGPYRPLAIILDIILNGGEGLDAFEDVVQEGAGKNFMVSASSSDSTVFLKEEDYELMMDNGLVFACSIIDSYDSGVLEGSGLRNDDGSLDFDALENCMEGHYYDDRLTKSYFYAEG